MTDQAYDQCDDERAAQEAARRPAKPTEDDKPYTPEELEPDEADPESLLDF